MEIIKGQADLALATLTGAAKIVLIDIAAEWCGPCKALAPVLAAIQVDEPDIKIFTIDVTEEAPTFVEDMKIRNIPTILFYKDGALMKITVGAQSKISILKIIDNLKE